MKLSIWCDRLIRTGFYLLFILVPLILTPWNYELFEYNKMMAVYALTVVIVGAWGVKMIAEGKIRVARTPLDIPILFFITSQFISSIFSIDPHVSWFGYYSRFNGGMWSIISYTLLFYAFVSNVLLSADKDQQDIKNQKSKIKNTNQKLNIEKQGKEITIQQYNNITILLKAGLAAATLVAIYGVLERLGIDKHLWVQDVQNRVFSTLGQPNWLAAYLVALGPLAWAFALKSQIPSTKHQTNPESQAPSIKQSVLKFGNWDFELARNLRFVIWSFVSILFFLVLLFTRSRSGLVGFAVADAAFWGLILLGILRFNLFGKKVKPFLTTLVICHLSFVILVFFNGTHVASIDRWFTLESWKARLTQPTTNNQQLTTNIATPSGTLLETGGTESGTIRKYVWQAAINAWTSSPKTLTFGTGTETFAFAFYQFRPKEHNLTSEWDFLYNKAHNEYLNFLATTGAFGLGTYLLFIVSFLVWFIKSQITNSKPLGHLNFDIVWGLDFGAWCLNMALFAGWVSVLITNFFGFSVVVTNLFLFLFPAMLFARSQQSNNTNIKQFLFSMPMEVSQAAQRVLSSTILLALLALLVLLVKHWYADTLFATGYRLSRGGQFAEANQYLSRAISLNPAEPLYHDEHGSVLAGLAVQSAEGQQATLAAQLVKQSLEESDMALSTSPGNVNFWKTRTKIYYAFSAFDPQFNAASIEALAKARDLSPADPKIYYNLAILYGRSRENNRAIDLLKQTIALKPNYRDAYWALYVFYSETKQPELARETLEDYLTKVDPNDKDFQQRVK